MRIHPLTAAVGLYLVRFWESEEKYRHFSDPAQGPNRTDPTRDMKLDTTGLCTSHLLAKSPALGFILFYFLIKMYYKVAVWKQGLFSIYL